MTFLDKLERRIGFIAVPGLIRIVVAFTALVYGLMFLAPEFISVLELEPARVIRGEVWRLFSYVFIPRSLHPLWLLLALWFLWFIGEGLERAWGAFRLTLYFLVGMLGTTIAAFAFGAQFSNQMLATSLFFAFARFYPDEVIYVFFILPLKIKWIAWIMAAFLMIGFVLNTNSYRIAMIAAFANYLLFFGPEYIREARNRREISTRRRRFESEARPDAEALHKCAVCGETELTSPDLDFRVARDGEEYCVAHLPKAQPAATANRAGP